MMTPSEAAALARERNQILTEILELTEREDFTEADAADDEKAERYVTLYNLRAGLMERLKAVGKQLEAAPVGGAAATILAEGEGTLRRLVELDERNTAAADAMMNALKQRLRDINAGREASVAYNTDFGGEDGHLYDEKH